MLYIVSEMLLNHFVKHFICGLKIKTNLYNELKPNLKIFIQTIHNQLIHHIFRFFHTSTNLHIENFQVKEPKNLSKPFIINIFRLYPR